MRAPCTVKVGLSRRHCTREQGTPNTSPRTYLPRIQPASAGASRNTSRLRRLGLNARVRAVGVGLAALSVKSAHHRRAQSRASRVTAQESAPLSGEAASQMVIFLSNLTDRHTARYKPWVSADCRCGTGLSHAQDRHSRVCGLTTSQTPLGKDHLHLPRASGHQKLPTWLGTAVVSAGW